MSPADPTTLSERYLAVRRRTEAIAAPLSPEDQQVQSQPECSPTKWHRAHTTWFLETFVLAPHGIAPYEPRWSQLFNSYYQALGPSHDRPRRGVLSRPSCAEIAAYRATVDGRVLALLVGGGDEQLRARIEIGLAHEEQHQELILTDALHALSGHPLEPAYRGPAPAPVAGAASPLTFTPHDGGLVEIGATPGVGFHFDNEGPRHRVWLEPFALADRPISVGEVEAFSADGGYRTASLWLSDGWDFVRAFDVRSPGHTRPDGRVFGLDGARSPSPAEPAAFVSYYEADAIARWLGARLPSEMEWEVAAHGRPDVGTFLDDDPATSALRPLPGVGAPLGQMFGDVWEWTRSSYEPYPGFAAAGGALGEYNGKFMNNQRVLRGGSCLTPRGHVRASYRNYWPAATRFQMTGVRLARPI